MRAERREGPIPKLTKQMSARRFLFFDTETMAEHKTVLSKTLKFRLGYAIYVEFGKDYEIKKICEHTLLRTDEFVELLAVYANKPGTLYCVAHNLQFDLQTLDLSFALAQSNFATDLPILSFNCTRWTGKFQGKPIHFMDSMNIFHMSLEELGKSVGIRKGKLPHEGLSIHALLDYCRQDVYILVRAFQRYLAFLNQHHLGYFSETIPWEAFTAYRTRFMTEPIHIHCDYPIISYEREAYFGARTECYFVGDAARQQYYLLDANSMYAAVMREQDYPCELLDTLYAPTWKQFRAGLDEFYCIANVDLQTTIPFAPYRSGAKLCFPVGHFRTWLHQPELRLACDLGYVTKVNLLITYRRANLFCDYVEFFYPMKVAARASGDKATEMMCKLFLNSLYGRWGMKQRLSFCLGAALHPGVNYASAYVEGTDVVYDEWDWYGKHYHVLQIGEKPHAFPAIAGAITAYGRMYLWEMMNNAGRQNVFYVDTDSLVVNNAGYDALHGQVDPALLGGLKLVEKASSL